MIVCIRNIFCFCFSTLVSLLNKHIYFFNFNTINLNHTDTTHSVYKKLCPLIFSKIYKWVVKILHCILLYEIIIIRRRMPEQNKHNQIYITLFLCLIINGRASRIGEPPPSYKWREQMQSSRGLGEGYHMRRPANRCKGECVAVLNGPATNLALVKPSSVGYCDLEFKVMS